MRCTAITQIYLQHCGLHCRLGDSISDFIHYVCKWQRGRRHTSSSASTASFINCATGFTVGIFVQKYGPVGDECITYNCKAAVFCGPTRDGRYYNFKLWHDIDVLRPIYTADATQLSSRKSTLLNRLYYLVTIATAVQENHNFPDFFLTNIKFPDFSRFSR